MGNLASKVTSAAFLLLVVCASFEVFRFWAPTRQQQVSAPATADQTPSYRAVEFVGAPDQRRPPCSANLSVSVENVEEFDWRSCSVSLQEFWEGLQIPGESFSDTFSLFEVSSIYADFDGDNSNERILRLVLRSPDGQKVRFILLKRVVSGNRIQWRRVAFVDTEYFHLDPQARVVSNGRGHWLAISGNEQAWGTGFFQENEIWYELVNSESLLQQEARLE